LSDGQIGWRRLFAALPGFLIARDGIVKSGALRIAKNKISKSEISK